MAFSFPASSRRIGVSISDRSIEMVEVRRRPNGALEVAAVAQGSLEPGVMERGKVLDEDRLSAALRAVRDAAKPGFRTNNVSVVLPDSVTYFHTFRLPGLLTDAEVATALSFQAEEVLPFASEEMLGDFFVLERNQKETVVQYAVALKDTVSKFRAAILRAGFQLESLGLEAQALSSVLLGGARKGKASLVADIGERTTTFFVRDEKGLCATFTSVIAGAAMTDAVMRVKKLPRDKAEALKRTAGVAGGDAAVGKALRAAINDLVVQAARIISWYHSIQPGRQVDEAVITGGSSMMPGLSEAMQEQMAKLHSDVSVRPGQAFARAAASPIVHSIVKNRQDAIFAPAFGAALTPGKGERSFDFLAASRRKVRAPATVTAASARIGKQGAVSGFAGKFANISEKQKLMAAGSLVGLAVVALLFAIWWRFNAERQIDAGIENLQQGEEAVDVTQPQTISVQISSVSQEGSILGRIVEITHAQEVRFQPANATAQPAQARGTVQLVNQSATSQALVATTRLQSAEGVLFRLSEAVTVPGGGRVQAQVYADQPGVTGNIGPTTFLIPGLTEERQQEVYAFSDAPMTGGEVFSGTVVQEDLDSIAGEAQFLVQQNFREIIGQQLTGDEVVLPDMTQIFLQEVQTDVVLGETVAEIVATATFSLRTLVFSQAEMELRVEEAAAALLGLAETWPSEGEMTLSEPVTTSVSSDLLFAELAVTVQFYPHTLP